MLSVFWAALGIGGSVAEVERAADALSGAAMDGLSAPSLEGVSGGGTAQSVLTAVERALGGVNVVIPLNVDGMKLGEASIRGINAVTKSAGRVLLNI